MNIANHPAGIDEDDIAIDELIAEFRIARALQHTAKRLGDWFKSNLYFFISNENGVRS